MVDLPEPGCSCQHLMVKRLIGLIVIKRGGRLARRLQPGFWTQGLGVVAFARLTTGRSTAFLDRYRNDFQDHSEVAATGSNDDSSSRQRPAAVGDAPQHSRARPQRGIRHALKRTVGRQASRRAPELMRQAQYSNHVQQLPLPPASQHDRQHTKLAGTTAKHPAAPLVRDEEAAGSNPATPTNSRRSAL